MRDSGASDTDVAAVNPGRALVRPHRPGIPKWVKVRSRKRSNFSAASGES